MLNFHAAVHDDFESRLACAFRRLVVNHTELHPDDFSSDRDSLIDDSRDGRRLTKISTISTGLGTSRKDA